MNRYRDRIGPKQIALLQSIKRGSRLYQEGGRWYLYSTERRIFRRYQNRERCMSLYLHGFLMGIDTQEGSQYAGGCRTRYDLTTKGELA